MMLVSSLGIFIVASLTWTAIDGSSRSNYGARNSYGRSAGYRELKYKIQMQEKEIAALQAENEANRNPPNGTMRLYLSQGPNEGMPQIFLNGRWGTFCNDAIDEEEAAVICRSLGLESTNPEVFEGTFGAGFAIWIDEVDCNGNESSILDCSFPSYLGDNDCNHSEDVSIKCI